MPSVFTLTRAAAAAAAVIGAAACSGTTRTVSGSPRGAYEAALASVDAGRSGQARPTLVAGWYDTRDGNGEIYLRELDGSGQAAGRELRLTADAADSYEVSLDGFGDALAVAWYDKATDGSLTGRLGVWDNIGRAESPSNRWRHSLGPRTRNPVVRARGDRIFCAWIGTVPADARAGTETPPAEAVWAGWWRADGAPIGGPQQVGPASRTTWNLNAALDAAGVAWVTYDAVAGTSSDELYLASVTERASSVARVSADDGVSSKYPDIAIDGPRAALTWFDERGGNTDVYLAAVQLGEGRERESGRLKAAPTLGSGRLKAAPTQAASTQARDVGAAFRRPIVPSPRRPVDLDARRVTHTPGQSIGAYLAWNGERLGLAWSDDSLRQHEIYFQAFDAALHPLAPPRRVTWTRPSSLIPAITRWQTGFALAWNEYTPPQDRTHGGASEITTAMVR